MGSMVCYADGLQRAWVVLTRKVGSSRWKRPRALENAAMPSLLLGATASDITGSGTLMDVREALMVPSVK
eukprot:5230043-Pyramimonas_sp.AAC.1